MEDHLLCFFDGACEPVNPKGNLGIGAIVLNKHKEPILQYSKYIKAEELSFNTTNNIAEYLGLFAVLQFLLVEKLNHEKIVVCGDSKLVIMQMKGEWKANGGAYIPYLEKARERASLFTNIDYRWIPREQNSAADKLSKTAMIENGCEFRIQKP